MGIAVFPVMKSCQDCGGALVLEIPNEVGVFCLVRNYYFMLVRSNIETPKRKWEADSECIRSGQSANVENKRFDLLAMEGPAPGRLSDRLNIASLSVVALPGANFMMLRPYRLLSFGGLGNSRDPQSDSSGLITATKKLST
ncbi:hypothetical protein PCH_Pc06g00200 [Penicillium rubens Wisconsin 54-1255]|uniref:Uncharacterized protein n=1 Tax=Penicillium rubens (strain ATCC 28089 / DSM 1075 / NRRL 1951 / Wisconsin 54-1255) TaxID=500485 RepID=B6GVW6_PENRW|nr:hypothetical protein PCH_Pc06g00200 [Penicillium rubens Wisconsin 54-1255]